MEGVMVVDIEEAELAEELRWGLNAIFWNELEAFGVYGGRLDQHLGLALMAWHFLIVRSR